MSLNTTERDQIITDALNELQQFASIPIKQEELEESISDAPSSKMQLKKEIFLHYAKRLRKSPQDHWNYDTDKIPSGLWKPISKLLTAIRVQELKEVTIVRRKGKYDIKELRDTYFGKKIMEDLPDLGNRWVLSKDEFDTVLMQCNKLNLQLPTVIEPTTTEKFFEE